MAKMNRKTEDSFMSTRMSSGAESGTSYDTSKSSRPQIAVKEVSSGKKSISTCLTHSQIEERARAIWQKKGCPMGQDEQNWLEAERQLKEELSCQ
jgi:hypothetical protein